MNPIFRFYSQSLKTHPRLTNGLSGGILFGLGDIIAQYMEKTDAPYDPVRTLRPFVYGALFVSVIGVKWYRFLNNSVRINGKPADHWMNTAARVACDQLLFAPVGIPFYFLSMAILEGGTPEQIRQKLADKWWPTLVTNWYIWPLFQTFNFTIVPVHYRLLTVNTLSIFWNTFLSYTNSEVKVLVDEA
ncbi:HFL149Wp [Eremothecium sinecaudum]|uniref:Protein SYM1 n=1 Tax=Eremothecium sinecaudum TaxID=45286 RepID=A0A109UZR1_9SACH|nr:HFL149Wp [Eremothecium sinecaudum]AMD21707.1 HFL149Wp [Eremothecium sinecaudum]